MATPNSRLLLARLHRDLAELQDSPYPGVAIFTDDANMRNLCLVLTPPGGPGRIWRCTSTSISRIAGCGPFLFGPWTYFSPSMCCSQHQFYGQSYTGGYSPALTLRGLFLQFLTFFSSTKVEQEGGYVVEIGDHVLTTFLRESELARVLDRWGTAALAQSNPAAENPVSREGGTVVHTTKEPLPGHERLHKLQRQNPRWASTLALISGWKCNKCPYGAEIPHHSTQADVDVETIVAPPLLNTPPICYLDELNDDILSVLAAHLPSESIISLSKAYPRFSAIVKAFHLLLQKELRCFYLRTSLQDSILGIGVSFNEGTRTLSSDFDWLSARAFDSFHVRKSVEKRNFEYFLPLPFNRAHFGRAHDQIWSRLNIINKAIQAHENIPKRNQGRNQSRNQGRNVVQSTVQNVLGQPHDCVKVIYKMMNNIVVSLMKSCDDVLDQSAPSKRTILHASEKAVISFCHLFHLLICLCGTTPAVHRDAVRRIRRFIDDPTSRTKQHLPDIGEFMVITILILALPDRAGPPITWSTLNGPLLEEAITRNVRWVLKDAPELEILENGTSEYRLNKTLLHSKTSLRLLMFQVAFLNIFTQTYASRISLLHDNYGFAEESLPSRMVAEIKAIYTVNAWPAFFQRVQYLQGMSFGKERFSEMLRQAVRTSGQRRYHTPSQRARLDSLSKERQLLEAKMTRGFRVS
ncbi:hypothetical protein BD779DRAFT_1736347 [Infundibulicybe gibba]|nr:hypothetical protein BD779DRAFT_1736347 [Infundibulicybe gibba]